MFNSCLHFIYLLVYLSIDLFYVKRRITELDAELCKIRSRYVLLLKDFSLPVKGLFFFAFVIIFV